MTLGFSFKEQPALHSVLALSSSSIGQCALHGVMTHVFFQANAPGFV
jgi:hypothetical protein